MATGENSIEARILLKIFVEIMKHTIIDCPSAPSGKFDMGYIVKTKTEHTTMTKAKKALKDIKLLSDDKKRIHICYHDGENRPCEII